MPRVLVVVAAILSLAASTVHINLTAEHWEEWWAYGVFFGAVAALQAAYAVLLLLWARRSDLPPPSRLLEAGIAGNVILIALYVLTRTFGVPLGPVAGEVEGVGPLDIVAKAAEAALVGTLLGLRRRQERAAGRHSAAG